MADFYSSSTASFLAQLTRQQDQLLRTLRRRTSSRRTSSTAMLERQLRTQLGKLATLTLERLGDQEGFSTSPHSSPQIRFSESQNNGLPFSPIAGLLGGLVQTGLTSLVNRTRIRTASYESERSLEALRNFRESRGQIQARTARELAKGQRNL